MYEIFIALRYLIPKKKSLSTSLISLVSIFVISLVVWLVLIFLSVTSGIEKNWLDKLTSLNAPLRISPTSFYYSSPYYKNDGSLEGSDFSYRTIGEKTGEHPVKEVYSILSKIEGITFQDYEIGGALLRIALDRKERVSYLSQMTFLTSFQDKNANLKKLILKDAKPLGKKGTKFLIYLPKSFQESSILIGDRGYLAYLADTGLSEQEVHIDIEVAGFYDPGVLPIGNRFIIVPRELTRIINKSSNTTSPDGSPMNGIYVWCKELKNATVLKTEIEDGLKKMAIAPFWQVTTYQKYEFSKDLLEQFESDQLLFSLIAVIILTVACSNIISFLVLLVNDKKKEIAILQAMGARKKNIALIFGLSGALVGTLSCSLGIVAAIFTLRHLDGLICLLSLVQGHSAFNEVFFGNKLPNTLSLSALYFVLIATPILATISGLIPAIKASKISPSNTLRSE